MGRIEALSFASALSFALFALIPIGAASAQSSNEGLAACAKVPDSLERLRCYDDLAKKVAADQQAPAATDTPQNPAPADSSETASTSGDIPEELKEWQVDEKKSPIDDSLSIFLTRVAMEPYRNQFGGQELAFLHIRCVENTTDVLVSTDTFLGLRDSVKVTIRLDSKSAADQWWSPSTNGQAVFAPQPIKFIKDLLAAGKLTVRLYPRNEGDVTAVFDLADLPNVIGKVQAACNWQ